MTGRNKQGFKLQVKSPQFLVIMGDKITCSCVEVQEMCWPCEHVMAWDDLLGKNPSRHFHSCWRTSSLRSLYELHVPVFMDDDLSLDMTCSAPEPAKVVGRHRMVRIQSGRGGLKKCLRVEKGQHVDATGNVFNVSH